MSHDDLNQKLATISAQTKGRLETQSQRHEDRKQEILLQNQLKSTPTDSDPEIIKLRHELDIQIRQRNRDDAIFYGNIDLQDFIKRQQVSQSHLLEEIHHTTFSTILEKAILMIISARLERVGGQDKHEQKMTEKTHDTGEQMRLEKFRAELTLQFGEAKTDDILSILERNIDDWDRENF